MCISNNLWEKEEDLKKYGIVLQETEKQKDFDFFVFIDQKEKNSPFLKELLNYIENSKNENENENFVDKQHEEELKEWIGGNNKDLITPLNWLKIAIEKYPYRLFVVTDEEKVENGSISKFIKKRICLISKKEWEKVWKDPEKAVIIEYKNSNVSLSGAERFKLWLYYKWIEHLAGKKIEKIAVYLPFPSAESAKHHTITLPEMPKVSSLIKEFSISLNIENSSNLKYIRKIEGLSQVKNNEYFIDYTRHNPNVLYLSYAIKICERCLHSEGISGSQNQFLIISSINNITYTKLVDFLSIVENAFLKILLIDERFEKFFKKISSLIKLKFLWCGICSIDKIEDFKIFDEKGDIEREIYLNNEDYKFSIDKNRYESWVKEVKNSNIDSQYLKKSRERLLEGWNTLIIHQGILDKLKKEKNIRQFIFKLKETFPFFIITSGRGKPAEIPKGEKFIPFSNIELIMKEYPEKLILIRMLLKLIERG